MLRAAGCAEGQGYLFSRPVPREKVLETIAADARAAARERADGSRLGRCPGAEPGRQVAHALEHHVGERRQALRRSPLPLRTPIAAPAPAARAISRSCRLSPITAICFDRDAGRRGEGVHDVGRRLRSLDGIVAEDVRQEAREVERGERRLASPQSRHWWRRPWRSRRRASVGRASLQRPGTGTEQVTPFLQKTLSIRSTMARCSAPASAGYQMRTMSHGVARRKRAAGAEAPGRRIEAAGDEHGLRRRARRLPQGRGRARDRRATSSPRNRGACRPCRREDRAWPLPCPRRGRSVKAGGAPPLVRSACARHYDGAGPRWPQPEGTGRR